MLTLHLAPRERKAMAIRANDTDLIYISCLLCEELEKIRDIVDVHIKINANNIHDKRILYIYHLKDKLVNMIKSYD